MPLRLSFLKRAVALIAVPMSAATGQMMNAGGSRPAVSPDGRLIAFSAARGGTWDVYVVGVDGTSERRVTDLAERNFVNLGPVAWIGDRLLVTRRLNDTTRSALFDVTGHGGSPPSWFSVAPDARQVRPSVNGRLVFVHGDPRHPRVAVANLDGTGVRDVLDGVRGALQPAWSPDGKQIAISRTDSAGNGDIAVLPAGGGDLRVVAHIDSSAGEPIWASWSPDGKRLAFQTGKYNPRKIEESTAQIWTVDVATGKTTPLASHTATYLDETPAWFPDGRRIAFQSNRTGILQIWTMQTDGSDARQLTTWQPPPAAK